MLDNKKKRVSKKTKKSWRKHVDINDVEQYLEDQRIDERLGGSFSALPNTDLFKIDTAPSTKSGSKIKRSLDELPKCFQLLQPLTKVPDPISKRNRVRTKDERKSQFVKNNETKRLQRGILKAKEKNAARNRELYRSQKESNKNKFGEFNNDLWNVEDITADDILHNEWNSNDTIRHTYRGLSKPRKRIPESLQQKHTLLPMVEPPHPGMSYNPSYKDHQDLLKSIVEKEEKIMKEERHIERVTTRMFKRVTPDEKANSWLVEMSEGLPKPDETSTQSDDDGEFKAINPPVMNKKKDRKQKRKQKEQRDLERTRNLAKIEKKKISDMYRLRMINKDIEKRDAKIKILKEKREKLKNYKKFEPKRLSSRKFETPDLEFNFGRDIAGNLRNIHAEGNLLADRFKSLQKRNILEPTVKQPPKKRTKVKRFPKSGHRVELGTNRVIKKKK